MSAKTIVITGTASGFGHLSVRRFSEAGWNVVATVRKEADPDTHTGVENVKTLLLDVNDPDRLPPGAARSPRRPRQPRRPPCGYTEVYVSAVSPMLECPRVSCTTKHGAKPRPAV